MDLEPTKPLSTAHKMNHRPSDNSWFQVSEILVLETSVYETYLMGRNSDDGLFDSSSFDIQKSEFLNHQPTRHILWVVENCTVRIMSRTWGLRLSTIGKKQRKHLVTVRRMYQMEVEMCGPQLVTERIIVCPVLLCDCMRELMLGMNNECYLRKICLTLCDGFIDSIMCDE